MRQLRNAAVILGALGIPILGQLAADHFKVSEYTQAILFKIGLNVTLAVSLSLIIGFTGQFSLGHGGFMSLGSFFSGLFTSVVIGHLTMGMSTDFLEGGTWAAVFLRVGCLLATMLIGMAAAVVGSILVGLPSLRLRGDYLAIATLSFGEIAYNFLLVFLQGRYLDTAYYIKSETGFMMQAVNLGSAWCLALFAILAVRNLVSSTSGGALRAIREDEIASGAVGIRTTRYKMVAFVVSSMLAGAAGVLEAHQTQTVNPANYRFDRSIEMIVPVVLGGSGSLSGTVLASVVFTYVLELLRGLPSGAQQYRTIVYASVLVLIMILRPQGLMGRLEFRDILQRIRKRSGSPAKDAKVLDSVATASTSSRLQFNAVGHSIHPVADSSTSSGGFGPIRRLRGCDGASLECDGLTIRFGGLTAVNSFHLCLRPLEIVGLIGPNGAGKTTCFNMITGIYRPTAGDIRLGGRSLVGRGCAATNNMGIARTFQNIRLFSELSVRDNVRLAMHAHLRSGLLAAILRTRAFYNDEDRADFATRELLNLFDLQPYSGDVATSLPYGAQRRLEIARALATQPSVLCLDEPAAGMNPVEKKELMQLIRRIRDRFQLTVLLIEHDMKVVMGVCERIVVLDHGETIAEGAPEDIRSNLKVIEAYLGEPMESKRSN